VQAIKRTKRINNLFNIIRVIEFFFKKLFKLRINVNNVYKALFLVIAFFTDNLFRYSGKNEAKNVEL